MDAEGHTEEFIMHYLGKPLASIGMMPTEKNPKGCGILFIGDGKLTSGSYFVWTNNSGVLIYIADFQVLESRPFSIEFPEFVSVRRDAKGHPGRGEMVAFAETAKRNATTFIEQGMHCNHVEVQYLAPYFDEDRLQGSGATVRDLARYLLDLGRKISWSPEVARPFVAIEDSNCTGVAAEFIFSGSSDLLMGTILEMKSASVFDRDDREAIFCVIQHIDQNLGKPLRQEEMLTLAGMSATKFKKLFKRATGMNMSDYISRHRVEYAKEMLLSGEPIGDVASEVGLNSPAYFATFFRHATGQSPSQWRQATQIHTLPPTDSTVHLIYSETQKILSSK